MSRESTNWLDVAGKIALGVGGVSLVSAGVLAVAKSGVVQSALARHRRESDAGRLVDGESIVPGTPLLVSLACGIAEHSGVYLGASRVAELSGDGRLREISLTNFINGELDPTNCRTGTRIFAACDGASARVLGVDFVSDAARSIIERIGFVRYNLFGNNCHMFTASCVFGRLLEKMSLADWVKGGTYTIDRLEGVVSNCLNNGLPVAWLGVRGPSAAFDYALTEEKIKRLKSEGVK